MKGTSLIAALLFFWVILAYILVGLMGFSIYYGFGTYHPLAFLQTDSLGKAAIWTVKWIYEVLVALFVFLVASFYPNYKVVITMLAFGEVFALFLSYGVV